MDAPLKVNKSRKQFLEFSILPKNERKTWKNYPKGQLISKRLLEKIVWTKIATKKFDNFCPGGQIKKNKDTLLH